MKIPEQLKSKKLWVLIAFVLLEIVNRFAVLNLDMTNIRTTVLAYMGAQGISDFAKNWGK